MYYHLSNLAEKNGADLTTAFSAITKDMTSLAIWGNVLGHKTAADLAAPFAAIPQGVTSLYLVGNGLLRKMSSDNAILFEAIAQGVKPQDLVRNDVAPRTPDELVAIFKALPPTINEITLSIDDLLYYKTEVQLLYLSRALPHVMTINVVGSDGSLVDHPNVVSLRKLAGSKILRPVLGVLHSNEVDSPNLPKELAYLVLSHATGIKSPQITARFATPPLLVQPAGAGRPTLPVAAESAGLTSHGVFRSERVEQKEHKELKEEHKQKPMGA